MTADTEPWLTIATVVMNDPVGLARTLASVKEQDQEGLEYLVVDSSDDRPATQEMVRGYGSYTWTPARGIYSAMNEALMTARGRFILFLNAGDTLYDATIVRRTHHVAVATDPVWMFGEVEIAEETGRTVVTTPWDYEVERKHSFARGRFPCHQGTFTRVVALRDIGGFDTRYRISADYAAFLRLSLIAPPTYLRFIVARFKEGGASTQHWAQSFREFHAARKEILQPHGRAAGSELAQTAHQFLTVAVYRGLVARWRQP